MRLVCKFSVAAVVLCVLGFLVWWNYGVFSWAYPERKLQLRAWFWRNVGDPFDVQRLRIAGFKPVDCSSRTSDKSNGLDCVAGAFGAHHSFQIRNDVCGIDSCGVAGVVGSSESKTYEIDYEVRNSDVKVWRRKCPTLVFGSAAGWSGCQTCCLPAPKSESEIEIL